MEKGPLSLHQISDENISRRFAEAPLAFPCEELKSDREHVKVVETCARQPAASVALPNTRKPIS